MSLKKHLIKYDIPNATTKRALIIAEAKEEGLIPDNVDDLMKALEEERK